MSRKLHPHPLTADEARRIVEACGGGVTGARNRALVALLWRAGLRAREACAIEVDHLRQLPDGRMVVRVERPKGWEKGTPPREVGLDKKTADLVAAWRDNPARGGGRFLFVTATGRPVHPSYLRQLLPMLARRAGIQRRVHPHALRHTFARQLYDEGVGLMEIMLALGHAQLSTTQKYLRSIGATEVIGVTSRREW